MMLTNTAVIVKMLIFYLNWLTKDTDFDLDTLLNLEIQNVIYIENKVHSNEEMISIDKRIEMTSSYVYSWLHSWSRDHLNRDTEFSVVIPSFWPLTEKHEWPFQLVRTFWFSSARLGPSPCAERLLRPFCQEARPCNKKYKYNNEYGNWWSIWCE